MFQEEGKKKKIFSTFSLFYIYILFIREYNLFINNYKITSTTKILRINEGYASQMVGKGIITGEGKYLNVPHLELNPRLVKEDARIKHLHTYERGDRLQFLPPISAIQP